MREIPDRRRAERFAATMVPVAILGTVAIVTLASFAGGTIALDEKRRQDDRADSRAEEQRLDND
ncbi:hypothetical protein [Rhizobium rhizophilum]|uniref:hypothetical protein n=1 Tax=Rhizobium rhizophilum TaxID=1850373 RepID=UPI0014562B47|nr:hypothetical protein [Rhizobium rhizophilum]